MWILKLFVFCCDFFCFVKGINLDNKSYIFGLGLIDCQSQEFSKGIPVVYGGESSKLYVFGNHLTSNIQIGFTNEDHCDYPIPGDLEQRKKPGTAVVFFTPPSKYAIWSKTKYYACLKEENETGWRYQGTGKHVSFYVSEPLFTTWMYIAIIIFCYLVSSLMTGLNLGLMSLDTNELQLLKKAGTPKERKYAAKIIPLRRNGNFLVCSIVITATLCNAISTVATETFLSGIATIVITTIMIVLFCEILPQSICSAFPLSIGARTAPFTRTFMILTSPISYPLSKFLDYILGKELRKSYTKKRLRELLKKTKLLTHEEKIIFGTLDFSSKKVEEVMTVIDDIFKLPITAVMNFETIVAILASGYSRIPIYVGEKSNILHVILTKDLALLDPDDKIPVKVLVQNSKSTCHYVPKGTSLDKVLGKFMASRHHMLFVTDDESISGKKREWVIGLVTFEDIIEEILQMEIVDETDTIFDNKGKRRISHMQKTELISLLLEHTKANAPSENLKLATFWFLLDIEELSVKYVSPKVLITLLNLDIFYTTTGSRLPQDTIYVHGVPADYFVMILEGEMEVKIGNEELIFEAGAFRYFGREALRKASLFVPDYTVQGVKKTVYLKITVALYNAALLATRFERFKEVPNINKSEVYQFYNLLVGSDIQS